MEQKPALSLNARPGLKTQLEPKLWGRIKMSNFMELGEIEYRKFIMELEGDPLFRRLAAVENPVDRIFSRRRFPGTDLVRNFCELNENTMAAAPGPDLAPMLKKWDGLLPLIRRIGMENFKRYFLYDEAGLAAAEAARECGITLEEVRTVKELVNDLNVLDLAQPSVPGPEAGANSVKVATVEPAPGEPGAFQIAYASAHDARGCYAINYKNLYELHKQGKFTPEEWRKIRNLIKKAELVNTRQTALYRILKKIVTAQAEYLRTGCDADLRPLTQVALAGELGVHRSTVHRAVEGRLLQTPCGDLKPIKDLLPSHKRCAQSFIGRLDPAQRAAMTDTALRGVLTARYGIPLARRTVCAYRAGSAR